jgi:hypothetical protein
MAPCRATGRPSAGTSIVWSETPVLVADFAQSAERCVTLRAPRLQDLAESSRRLCLSADASPHVEDAPLTDVGQRRSAPTRFSDAGEADLPREQWCSQRAAYWERPQSDGVAACSTSESRWETAPAGSGGCAVGGGRDGIEGLALILGFALLRRRRSRRERHPPSVRQSLRLLRHGTVHEVDPSGRTRRGARCARRARRYARPCVTCRDVCPRRAALASAPRAGKVRPLGLARRQRALGDGRARCPRARTTRPRRPALPGNQAVRTGVSSCGAPWCKRERLVPQVRMLFSIPRTRCKVSRRRRERG